MRGWVRIFSYTHPRENIINYRPWYLMQGHEWLERPVVDGRSHGKGVIARLEGCEDRDAAAAMIGTEIGIRRSQMPQPREGEFYWSDLQGMSVCNLQGDRLGTVDHLLETGANDVLVVEGDRQRLIPFVMHRFIVSVDQERGEIRVDWDKDF